MITADKIAIGALVVSCINFVFTIYSNNQNSRKSIKNEQNSYLKALTRLVKNISFHSSVESKLNTLDLVREELTFCSCFDKNLSFENFSCELDDQVYTLCTTKIESDFIQLKESCANEIRNFLST